jgi:hypothetical protein
MGRWQLPGGFVEVWKSENEEDDDGAELFLATSDSRER